MAERRIGYLVILIGSVVFFWAYREWLSWILLMIAVFLPWLSFLVSLPAMLTIRVTVKCPESVSMGTETKGSLVGSGKLPLPPIRGKIRAERVLTGQKWRLKGKAALPTEHCGTLTVSPWRVWVYDYLGLLRLPALHKQTATLQVMPLPLPAATVPDMSRYLANAYKPKPGGGFSENHELRLYRPGDNLHQIHWKLSAKTGQLILREPMEAVRGLALVSLSLSGTPEELDRKLGRLSWLSRQLLEQGISHQVDCMTGTGVESFSLQHATDLQDMLSKLLASAPARETDFAGNTRASWRCQIGGEADEA